MQNIKAIFDADILIHLIKTDAIEFAISVLGDIYISEYVYNNEIRKDTSEGKKIEKLKNIKKLRVLKYSDLTDNQKNVYRETYKLLSNQSISFPKKDNPINEGERITASMSKACNIYYYMSDDNKASSFIKSLAAIDVVNYCDILYLYLRAFNKSNIEKLRCAFYHFVGLYDKNKIPKILKDKNGNHSFEYSMAISYDRFEKNKNLKNLLIKLENNLKIHVAIDKE